MYYSTFIRIQGGKFLINYYNPIHTKEGYTLSIDKIVIDYYISNLSKRNALPIMLDNLPIRYAVKVVHWSSLRIGTFRENFTITFQDGNSFWLGVGLNSKAPIWGRMRLEFNPNKCATHCSFLGLLGWLNENCHRFQTTIKRYDLAIDIPVERANSQLIKGHQAYSEIRKSKDDQTQYLGSKSSVVGRTKLYNKSLEAGLDHPLTRLELTLDPATPYGEINWPKVYIVRTEQIGLAELKLTDTERFVLGALLQGYGSLTDLGRKTRVKMEAAIDDYVQWVNVSKQDYILVISRLQAFLSYPRIALDIGPLDVDQPPALLPISFFPAWLLEAEKLSDDDI